VPGRFLTVKIEVRKEGSKYAKTVQKLLIVGWFDHGSELQLFENDSSQRF
jgi:hypothetical protein